MGLTDPIFETPARQESDWSDPRAGSHAVQFYSRDNYLVAALARFVGNAMAAGHAAAIIATEPHRKELRTLLEARAFDVSQAMRRGRYVELDAAHTLSRLLVDGWPDDALFERVVGGLVSDMTGEFGHLAAFGEMVALLWADGRFDAALRLEQLWNALGDRHHFALRCAYPIQGFYRHGLAERLHNICKEHSCVFPAESHAF